MGTANASLQTVRLWAEKQQVRLGERSSRCAPLQLWTCGPAPAWRSSTSSALLVSSDIDDARGG